MYPWTSGTFYKAAVQEILLLYEETWVIPPRIGKTIGGFRHRVARHLVGMRPSWYTMGRLFYPPLGAVMTEVGLEEVETYILCLQNTVAQYNLTSLVLYLCLVEERRPGAQMT